MKALGLIVFAVIAAGCTPKPVHMESQDAQKLVDAMVFVKHANGMCFGVINSERVTMRGDITQSVAVTQVACKP